MFDRNQLNVKLETTNIVNLVKESIEILKP